LRPALLEDIPQFQVIRFSRLMAAWHAKVQESLSCLLHELALDRRYESSDEVPAFDTINCQDLKILKRVFVENSIAVSRPKRSIERIEPPQFAQGKS